MGIPDAANEVDPATPPMEARQVDRLPSEPGWQFEPKWDGFRCLLFRAGNRAEVAGKSGKSLARFFPEIVSLVERIEPENFALDGELIVEANGALSFDALQMRLHPAASRIKRLSLETPATVILFDALAINGNTLLQAPLVDRRKALESFYKNAEEPLLRLSPFTRDVATASDWLEASGGPIDGVVAKRLDGPYEPGKRTMIKVKRLRTADCVVGGFRYLERERLVGSLLLGLYNESGELDHVGFTSAISAQDRGELTKLLEELIEPPGFTGKAPGGPSRWATEKSSAWEPLRRVLVVEVQYDHMTANRFRHGTKLIRWRLDKSPRQCTFDQLPVRGSPVFGELFPSA
jgi:ATP-dependent DNA ligase